MAIPFKLDGVIYSIAPHREAKGHFATWECVTCGTVGGMTRVCEDDAAAVEAAHIAIAGHQARSHPVAGREDLFSLAYSSQASVGFSKSSLDELAQRAAAKNAILDVTGYLTFDVDFETFFQFLEGPKSVVESLMNVISEDPRHRILNVVHISEAERQFAAASAAASAWSLPQVDPSSMASHAEARMFSSWRMKLITRSDFHVMDMEDVVISVLASMRKESLGGEYITGAILDMSYLLRFRAPLAML